MSYHEGSNWQAKKEDAGLPLYDNKKDKLDKDVVMQKTNADIVFQKGETVLHYPNTVHQKEVTYLSEFMYKGEKWFNIQLQNGGFMETQYIGKKSNQITK